MLVVEGERRPASEESPMAIKNAPQVYSAAEVREMLDALNDSTRDVRLAALIALLFGSGLRIAEALALVEEDLALTEVRVRNGKNGKHRLVGISPDARPAIEHWLARRAALGVPASAPLFCAFKEGALGAPWTPHCARNSVRSMAARIDAARRVHPHGFRHSHAVALLKSGADLPTIQGQLGHASLAATGTYLAHLSADALSEATAAIRF